MTDQNIPTGTHTIEFTNVAIKLLNDVIDLFFDASLDPEKDQYLPSTVFLTVAMSISSLPRDNTRARA